ncbi:MAG: ComEC/Rec2 family competence protein [Brotaphodocola sp.]
MGQKKHRRWFSGSVVAGLLMAAIVSGPSAQAANGEIPILKSDFHLTDQVTDGIAVLQNGIHVAVINNDNQSGVAGAIQAGDSVPAGVAAADVTALSTATADVTALNGTAAVTAGTLEKTSSVVVAGGNASSGTSIGPSIYGNIVTEGEKENTNPQESILGGASLTMLNSQSDSQILSAIIQTSQGSLIVVDGGLGADGDYLKSQIQARGGHVSAWLITHPHGDHVGALYKILQDEAAGISSGITIDGIYYSFASRDWYTLHDKDEVTMAHSIIGTFEGLPQSMLHTVSKGQTIQVDDVTILVMNDRYELASDKGNNAGIVYKVYVNGKSILFLGDMAEEGGRRLLADVGAEALKSDMVQMAHHGQNGVDESVYQAIDPAICLWPTPKWLWENSGNRYRIAETKNWISKLNVQKHYCMKDGDQVIY